MENLNFIDPLLHGIVPQGLEQSTTKLSVKQMVLAGVGSLVAGAILKKTGHHITGAIVGSLALPILATACYKKFGNKPKDESHVSSGIEYNH
ncbi:hypothetical protein EV144_104234 [Flavobacterium sp. 270]|uniref:PrgI family protein n=1 Tax=Flavobacterium sp. 270 TaxID=2512114 RepID=UPI0010665348|nr:PrgI family protein [Flavobacterium sp. 270]TDW47948.1 hypothetical protein EV144_104234 [Flavobacterium sp. 270]